MGSGRYRARMTEIQTPEQPESAPAEAVQEQVPQKQGRTREWLVGVLATGLVPLAVIALVWYWVTADTSLERAAETCAPFSSYAVIGDDGDTLTIRSLGKKDAGLSLAQLECFMTELEVTDAIRSEIGSTRALDGRQTGDWDDYHASWAYHPDHGLGMVVTLD